MNAKYGSIVCFCTELEKFYYSPIVTLMGYNNGDFLNMYTFIGNSNAWEGEAPIPIEGSMEFIKNSYKNIICMKKINQFDLSIVAERIDWQQNSFYYAYSEKAFLSRRDAEGKLLLKFYVRNKYDQVFKCLWNNINSNDTYNIVDIQNNTSYYTVVHSGGTFDVGSYVTLQNINPSDFQGTLKVISSGRNVANVAFGESSSYFVSTEREYTSGGTIKSAVLSTAEPIMESGTYDQNNVIRTSDGYKWKYLFTIDKGAKTKFFDENWFPVPVVEEFPNQILSTSKAGSIDVINVVDGGSGYQNGTNTVNITITGDGNGAIAEAYVSNNKIEEIVVLNPGENYTRANVYITPAFNFSGAGAQVDFSISPIGGHGFSPIRDLYTRNIMISTPFFRDEEGRLPTDIKYNQVGVLYNPYLYSDLNNHANTTFINCMTDVLVSSEGGEYIVGETVYQGFTYENSYFEGRIVNIDSINNTIKLVGITGTPRENYELIGKESRATKIAQQINPPLYVPFTGNVFYLENRVSIQRDPLGFEQLRILIKFSN